MIIVNNDKTNAIMRKIIHYKKQFLTFAAVTMLTGLAGCSEENVQDVTPEITEAEATPKVTMYTPTSGGNNTQLKLYGTHLGKDLTNVKVTVNGTEATVNGAFGNYVTATVAKGSGSGQVKVFVKKGESEVEMTYGTPFEYYAGALVSTLFGEKIDDVSGKKYGSLQEARLWQPLAIKFDKNGTLYIIQSEANPDVAMVKDGQVSQFLKGSTTNGGKLNRMRDLAISKDGNTMYIANDYNGKGEAHIVSIPWNDNCFNTEDTEVLVDKNNSDIDAGMTNVAVHPINGKIYSVKHNPGEIYVYDEEQSKMVTTGVKLPDESNDPKFESHCMLFSKDGTTVYISSQRKHVIFKGTYDLTAQSFSNLKPWVGQFGIAGWQEGTGTNAKLNEPYQMDIDNNGNLYVAVFKAHRIAKITPDGTMTCYAGTGTSGTTNGKSEIAQFNHPSGVQFGPDGALYVAEYWNHMIRKIETE